MKILSINTADNNYEIRIERGSLENIGEIVSDALGLCRLCVVSDRNVAALYMDDVLHRFKSAGFDVCSFVIAGGEGSKTMSVANSLVEFLAEMGFGRTDMIAALGGGVVGDLAGFAASMFMRGIEYIQIPTTVLAALDSSVGGKTAVNLKEGKNLAGAFWQPRMVICDPNAFGTLPREVYTAGLAEAIKCAVIADRHMFEDFEVGSYDIDDVIARCIAIKARLVEEDERDNGSRMLLNLGHSVGHAVEKCSDYEISHGEAVAIGLYAITKAGGNKRLIDRIYRTLAMNGLPWMCNIDKDAILDAICFDKKRRNDRMSLVIPKNIGSCEIVEMPMEEALSYIEKGLE